MTKILTALGFVLVLTDVSGAQSYCAQVKEAVATYGYVAARRYAVAHYTAREVRVADACLSKGHRRSGRHHASR